MRLRNLCKGNDDGCECEDGHCNDHCRSSILDSRIVNASSHEIAQQNRSYCATDGVAGTSKLNETVACISTAAESVEHRIHNDVEHTH